MGFVSSDLGKVLILPSFGGLSQWAVVGEYFVLDMEMCWPFSLNFSAISIAGDTHPLGCAFDESIVHHKVLTIKDLARLSSTSISNVTIINQIKLIKLLCFLQYFEGNPDHSNPSYNTKNGVYSEGCGLENVMISWGHDDYMYLVYMHSHNSDRPASTNICTYLS